MVVHIRPFPLPKNTQFIITDAVDNYSETQNRKYTESFIHVLHHNQEREKGIISIAEAGGATPLAYKHTLSHTPNRQQGASRLLGPRELATSFTPTHVRILASLSPNALDAQLRPNSLCMLAGTALFIRPALQAV